MNHVCDSLGQVIFHDCAGLEGAKNHVCDSLQWAKNHVCDNCALNERARELGRSHRYLREGAKGLLRGCGDSSDMVSAVSAPEPQYSYVAGSSCRQHPSTSTLFALVTVSYSPFCALVTISKCPNHALVTISRCPCAVVMERDGNRMRRRVTLALPSMAKTVAMACPGRSKTVAEHVSPTAKMVANKGQQDSAPRSSASP
jgi:hypothetical protein